MATTDDDTTLPFPDDDPPSSITRDDISVEFCHPFPPSPLVVPPTFDPRWRTETVVALARGIDIDAAFDRLPILADALEEAGCDHTPLLHHCRTCPHPFACCWVVNVILDRVPGELPPDVNPPATSPHIPGPRPSPRITLTARLNASVGWKYLVWGLFLFTVAFQLLRMLNIIVPKPPNPTVTLSPTAP